MMAGDIGGSARITTHREHGFSTIVRALFALLLIRFGNARHEHPSFGVTTDENGERHDDCTVDDLMPDYLASGDLSSMWAENSLVSPPYDCTCNTLKASYFCPNLGDKGYPKWIPRAVAEGSCRSVPREQLKHEPFPPGFRLLFYGNSHLRQVVEGIVCAYSSKIHHRRVTLVDSVSRITEDVIVGPDLHCRSCESNPRSMRDFLETNGCLNDGGTENVCSCDDNNSVFEFDNGAIIHYHFAHKEEVKRIEDGLRVHGTKFSDYDAVVANAGNEPRMATSETIRSAEELESLGVPLFWMTTYEGTGDVSEWTSHDRHQFQKSGARFLPVHRMVESLKYLTKGAVEGELNPHFCMPGPPNEIGVLLLKIAWAIAGAEGWEGHTR